MQPDRILNLSFHGIGRPIGRDFVEGERGLWAKPQTFTAALDAVADRDAVILSFDDGNTTDVDVALPALLERGLSATFFIVPGWLGTHGYMTRRDVRELVAHGMTVGNHGLQHHDWTRLAPDRLEHEVAQGRRLLEELTETSVETLAIPYGAYNETVLATLQSGGYRHVFTGDGGTAEPGAWLQPREHVRTEHDPAAIEELIERRLS